jgi:alkylation response protein AidB-like acyl-CoA dehydrogenase
MQTSATQLRTSDAEDFAALLSKARKIAPGLSTASAGNESNGRLSDTTIELLRSGDFFGLSVPRCLGGWEADAITHLEVVEEISRADGATGWVLMACLVGTGTAGAFLPPRAAQAMFASKIAIAAGEGAPKGRADKVEGGYRLTGNWSFGSGVLHAEYIHTGATVFENGIIRCLAGTNAPEARTFIIPVEKAQFNGNWDVLGLRGTGSIDYSLADVFVPDEYTHLAAETLAQQGGDFYRLGVQGMAVLGHTGFTLGIGRRILDELVEYVRSGKGRPGTLAVSEGFQEDYALAEGRLRAARAFIFETWRDVTVGLRNGGPTQRQFTLMRLGLIHLNNAVAENAVFAHRSAGSIALRSGDLQRCLRDVFTATQHKIVSPMFTRDCGQEFIGSEKKWTNRGLV